MKGQLEHIALWDSVHTLLYTAHTLIYDARYLHIVYCIHVLYTAERVKVVC